MNYIKDKLSHMTKKEAISSLKKKHENILSVIDKREGVYIWGTGQLGQFVYAQCGKNNVFVHGFIDNNKDNFSAEEKIFSCDILKQKDTVIIASFFCVEIADQLKNLGIKNYIYYEDLAQILDGFDTYYPAFQGIHEELETNKAKYMHLYDILADELSREIYANLINYRMSLDTKYTIDALNLSLQNGSQYFDKVITEKMERSYIFFDVGAFDGESTLDFINHVGKYRKIYFFEPDKNIIENAKKRLQSKENIIFVQAGGSEKTSTAHYDAIGKGAGAIADSGTEIIRTVALDDYVEDGRTYIKMDIEGHEMYALEGMKNSIMRYKPLLAISVYHQCGDMHKLVDVILSWNPDYKVYMRHYTNTYADTVCYFVDDTLNVV